MVVVEAVAARGVMVIHSAGVYTLWVFMLLVDYRWVTYNYKFML